MKLRKLTALAMLVALSVVLIWLVHFPIFPAAPFLEYDAADVPILIGAFAFGPLAGIIITVAASVIQGVTVSAQSGVYGIIMHILSTGTLVLVAGGIYRRKTTRGGAAIGLLAGALAMTAVMAVANLIVTPAFMGVPVEAVKPMLFTIIVPFNLIKATINGVITFLVYKVVSRFIKCGPGVKETAVEGCDGVQP